jgi:hypothetical protein
MANAVHAHFMLDNKGYGHLLRKSNTFCFSAATKITRTHPTVPSICSLPVMLLSSYSFVCLFFNLYLFHLLLTRLINCISF